MTTTIDRLPTGRLKNSPVQATYDMANGEANVSVIEKPSKNSAPQRESNTDIAIDPDSYPVEFVQISDKDGGGWLASYPDLPGCHAMGHSRAEALEKGAIAVREWIKIVESRNMKVPEPQSHELLRGRISIRVPKALHKRIAEQARCEDKSINSFVNLIVEEELDILSQNSETAQTRRIKIQRSLGRWAQRQFDFPMLSWSDKDHGEYSGEWVQRLPSSIHHALRYRASEQQVTINALLLSLMGIAVGKREGAALAKAG